MVKIRDFVLAAPYIAAGYNGALDIVLKQVGATREVTVRDLTPLDLGDTVNIANFTHTYAAANTFETLYSTTVPNRRAFNIYGFSEVGSTPRTTIVRVTVGSSLLRQIWIQDVQDLSQYGRSVYLFPDDQVIAQENQTVLIQGASASAGAGNLNILGFVAEPKGETIYKDTKMITKI